MCKVFQNLDVYPLYLKNFYSNFTAHSYDHFHRKFLLDGFNSVHILEPVQQGTGTFSIGNDTVSQKLWAKENGLRKNNPEKILLSQIEDSQADVFYNMDPVRFDSTFVKKLPGNIRKTIAWRAAPNAARDFTSYDRVVCNFRSIQKYYEKQGCRTGTLYPAHDRTLEKTKSENRDVDISFVGTYSRHHVARSKVVELAASLNESNMVRLHLQKSSLTELASSALGHLPMLKRHRLPKTIQSVSKNPIFGRELYSLFGQSKIVLNGGIDMSGMEKGNMRCWEAMGAGALLLTDHGSYPPGMIDGETMITYKSLDDLDEKIRLLLSKGDVLKKIAADGSEMIASLYSKNRQWRMFCDLL